MTRTTLVFAVLALVSCEVPFDPVLESDLAFSMSGYLDASADTQWVRVERLDPTLAVEPGPLDAEVTLDGPDGPATLSPVTRQFSTGPAHLFWTTAPVRVGATYVLAARGVDGRTAQTAVAIPDTAGVRVIVQDGPLACPAVVVITGAPVVPDVFAVYGVTSGAGGRRERWISKRSTFDIRPDGRVRALIYFGDDAERLGLSPIPGVDEVTTEAVAVVASADWPALDAASLETALLETTSGRVEGGVGFVGGAVTYRMPFTPGIGAPPIPGVPQPPVPCVVPGRR